MSKKLTQSNNESSNEANLSKMAMEIKKIPNVEDFIERQINKDGVDIKTATGRFKYNERIINYISIENGDYLFVNFRLNVKYVQEQIIDSLKNKEKLLDYVNEKNKANLGLKFFVSETDEESLLVSSNVEYVLSNKIEDFSFINNALEIISISPSLLKISKASE